MEGNAVGLLIVIIFLVIAIGIAIFMWYKLKKLRRESLSGSGSGSIETVNSDGSSLHMPVKKSSKKSKIVEIFTLNKLKSKENEHVIHEKKYGQDKWVALRKSDEEIERDLVRRTSIDSPPIDAKIGSNDSPPDTFTAANSILLSPKTPSREHHVRRIPSDENKIRKVASHGHKEKVPFGGLKVKKIPSGGKKSKPPSAEKVVSKVPSSSDVVKKVPSGRQLEKTPSSGSLKVDSYPSRLDLPSLGKIPGGNMRPLASSGTTQLMDTQTTNSSKDSSSSSSSSDDTIGKVNDAKNTTPSKVEKEKNRKSLEKRSSLEKVPSKQDPVIEIDQIVNKAQLTPRKVGSGSILFESTDKSFTEVDPEDKDDELYEAKRGQLEAPGHVFGEVKKPSPPKTPSPIVRTPSGPFDTFTQEPSQVSNQSRTSSSSQRSKSPPRRRWRWRRGSRWARWGRRRSKARSRSKSRSRIRSRSTRSKSRRSNS